MFTHIPINPGVGVVPITELEIGPDVLINVVVGDDGLLSVAMGTRVPVGAIPMVELATTEVVTTSKENVPVAPTDDIRLVATSEDDGCITVMTLVGVFIINEEVGFRGAEEIVSSATDIEFVT